MGSEVILYVSLVAHTLNKLQYDFMTVGTMACSMNVL
jgi:hypothetical protein